MDAATLHQQIAACQLRVQNYQAENNSLNTKLCRLSDAEQKYRQRHREFLTHLQRAEAKLRQASAVSRIRAAQSAGDSLSGFYGGRQSSAADQAYQGILAEISRARQQLEEQRASNNAAIQNINSEISQHRQHLFSLS